MLAVKTLVVESCLHCVSIQRDSYLCDDSGSYSRASGPADPSFGGSGIELVDFDGDGDLGVLYTNGDTFDSFFVKPYHGVRWIENQGDGKWADHVLALL